MFHLLRLLNFYRPFVFFLKCLTDNSGIYYTIVGTAVKFTAAAATANNESPQ